MGPKEGSALPLSRERGAGSPSNTTRPLACAQVYFRTRWRLHPSSRLATIDMGRKLDGGCAPFLGGVGSPSNTQSPGPRSTSIPGGILVHSAVWRQRTWAENWGLCPFTGGGAGSPSNTMSPRLRPTSLLSGILMHPAV